MYDPILTIITFIHNRMHFLKRSLTKEEFKSLSYTIWAANEILTRIQDHPMIDPEFLIEDFIIEMTGYSNLSKNEQARLIFSIAIEAADELYVLIRTSKGEQQWQKRK